MCVSEGAAGTSLIVVIVIVLVMAPRFSLPVSIAPVRIFPLVIARVAVNNRWPINYGRRSIPYRRWSVVDDYRRPNHRKGNTKKYAHMHMGRSRAGHARGCNSSHYQNTKSLHFFPGSKSIRTRPTTWAISKVYRLT